MTTVFEASYSELKALEDKNAKLRAELQRVYNELEVSEAVNRAKTVCIAQIRDALNRLSGKLD